MKFWKRKPTPEIPDPFEHDPMARQEARVKAALEQAYEVFRSQYLLVRDPDGTWTAYHKHPVHGSWFVWRRLTYVPELRGEKNVRPFTVATDHPNTVGWDVPDTFPEEWSA